MAGVDEADDAWDSSLLDEGFVANAVMSEPSFEERRRAAEVEERRRRADEARALELATDAAERKARRRRQRRGPLACLAVLALIIGLALWVRSDPDGLDEAPTNSDIADTMDWVSGETPPPSDESRPTPVGTPHEVTDPGHGYEFLSTQPGRTEPVAYDPCRPVHYVVNAGGASAEQTQLVDHAIDVIADATGLVFVDDGASDEVPSLDRSPYQPRRYGDRWAPVLIVWSDEDRFPELADGVLGVGGSMPYESGGDVLYVSGQLVIDAADIDDLLGEPRGAQRARGVIEHELGHVVGLDHTGDETQLMYPYSTENSAGFGAGDLFGLAELGRGRCFPDV